jgi:REP element-mobilizing transposase RayT
MPRTRRNFKNNTYYHVFNRGVNKEKIFPIDKDKEFFIGLLYKELGKTDLILDSYVIMNNHYHLILKINSNTDMIGKYMQRVCTTYARYINDRLSRTGHVFQGRYKTKELPNRKALKQARGYLEENPVKAKYVQKPEDYPWRKIWK